MDKRQVLDFITNAPGVVIGQHTGDGWTATTLTWKYNYDYHVTNLRDMTGKYPALLGGAFGSGDTLYGGSLQWNVGKIVPLLIAFHEMGGLIQVDCHHYNPWNNGSYGTLRGGPWSDLTTPGTTAYTNWHGQLDTIHAGLLALNQAGVVPLWRPFPEMTHAEGAWWRIGPGWWTSERDAIHAGFIAAWRDMWQRFSDLCLIWVYSAGNTAPVIACDAVWPGDEYVDIAGLSLYRSAPDDNTAMGVSQLKAHGKLFVFSESGCKPSNGTASLMVYLDQIVRYGARYALFWPSWNDSSGQMALVDQQNVVEFMSDQRVVTLDELNERESEIMSVIANLEVVAVALETRATTIEAEVAALRAQAAAIRAEYAALRSIDDQLGALADVIET